jgi:predicted transcriptional regulator of viral defense system
MKTIELLEKLKAMEKPVFTIQDFSKILGKGQDYTRLYVHRLRQRGLIEDVERGKYAMPMTDPMEIATNMVFPSYVSFLSGLRFHNLTTQLPIMVTVACARQKKLIKKKTYSIKFVKLKSERMFGYSRMKYYDNKAVMVGEPEKVIVDCLFLPENCPVSETFDALAEGGFDMERLLKYAAGMKSSVVLKRLGYMLELRGIDVHDRLGCMLTPAYDLLNPFLPRRGERNAKWRLMINEKLEAR